MNLDVIQSFLYASVFILGLLVEKIKQDIHTPIVKNRVITGINITDV